MTDLVAKTEQEMQVLIDKLSHCCKFFGFIINLDKTVVKSQPTLWSSYIKPGIFDDASK